MVAEKVGNFLFRAPVARSLTNLAHHESLGVRLDCLGIKRIRSVISDVRIGKDNDLSGVGGIGEDFLVSGKRCIENDLAKALVGGSMTPPPEYSPVF